MAETEAGNGQRSVTVVVLGASGREVLLHLRGEIRLWSLPGGGVEPGEDWQIAAAREVAEETGYEVRIDRLVGEYRRPRLGDTKRVFMARVTGGSARLSPPESSRLAWFPCDRLPLNRLPLHRAYVEDAIARYPEPVKRVQRQAWWQRLVMRALFVPGDLREFFRSQR